MFTSALHLTKHEALALIHLFDLSDMPGAERLLESVPDESLDDMAQMGLDSLADRTLLTWDGEVWVPSDDLRGFIAGIMFPQYSIVVTTQDQEIGGQQIAFFGTPELWFQFALLPNAALHIEIVRSIGDVLERIFRQCRLTGEEAREVETCTYDLPTSTVEAWLAEPDHVNDDQVLPERVVAAFRQPDCVTTVALMSNAESPDMFGLSVVEHQGAFLFCDFEGDVCHLVTQSAQAAIQRIVDSIQRSVRLPD